MNILLGSSEDEVDEDTDERRIEAKFDGKIGEFGIRHSWNRGVRTIDMKNEDCGEMYLEGQRRHRQ